jgi:CRISPR system Cascade subunit CasD
MKYLSLWFESPLQSWGVDSKFGLRTTFTFPTKSGIAGIILAALGKGGEEREFLESFSQWNEIAFSFTTKNEQHGTTLNTDFHMVGSGYDSNDEWQNLMIPKKRDGNAPGNTGGVKLTYRQYLQDAFFGVILEMPSSSYEPEMISSALQNPIWPLYLGRKCCVPSYPIFQGLFGSYEESKTRIDEIAGEKELLLKETMKEGSDPYSGDVICINDVPVAFGKYKVYRDRFVTIVKNG